MAVSIKDVVFVIHFRCFENDVRIAAVLMLPGAVDADRGALEIRISVSEGSVAGIVGEGDTHFPPESDFSVETDLDGIVADGNIRILRIEGILPAVVFRPDAGFTRIHAKIAHAFHEVVIFHAPQEGGTGHCSLGAFHHGRFIIAVDDIRGRRMERARLVAADTVFFGEGDVAEFDDGGRRGEAFGDADMTGKIIFRFGAFFHNGASVRQFLCKVSDDFDGLVFVVHIETGVVREKGDVGTFGGGNNVDKSSVNRCRIFFVVRIEGFHVTTVILGDYSKIRLSHIQNTGRCFRITAGKRFQLRIFVVSVNNRTVLDGGFHGPIL